MKKKQKTAFMTTITTISSQHSGQSCKVFGKVYGVRDDQKFLKMVTIRNKSDQKHFIITIFIIVRIITVMQTHLIRKVA